MGDGGHLTHPVLGQGRRCLDPALVEGIDPDDGGHEQQADGGEHRVGDEDPHAGDEEEHDHPGGEGHRRQHLGGGLGIGVGVGQQLTRRVAAVVLKGQRLVLAHDLLPQRGVDAHLGDRGHTSAQDDGRRLDKADPHDGERPEGDGP